MAEASAESSGQHSLATGMAFLAGWGDVITFSRWGSYAIMMTGNTLNAATALGSAQFGDAAFNAAVVLAYAAGASGFRLAELRHPTTPKLSAAAAVVALYVAADLLVLSSSARARWPLLLLALGGGMINAASAAATGSVTAMVTGHLQRLGSRYGELVDRLIGGGGLGGGGGGGGGVGQPTVRSLAVLTAFAAGAAGAAFACGHAALSGVARRLTPFSFSLLGLAHAGLLCAGLRRGVEPCELDPEETACEAEVEGGAERAGVPRVP